MKIQNLYSTLKPYAVLSVLVLGISSLGVNAMGDKNSKHNASMSQEKVEDGVERHGKMKKRFQRLAKKLDLSQEQRSEIKLVFASMKEHRASHKAALSGFKEQVKSLLKVSKFDENQFKAIYAEYQPQFQKIALEKAKTRHAIMQILTPEQQEKYLAMRKHR